MFETNAPVHSRAYAGWRSGANEMSSSAASRRRRRLPARPLRLPLLEEGEHAFMGVVELGVVDHHRAREPVGGALVERFLLRRTRACRARARPSSTARFVRRARPLRRRARSRGTTRFTSPHSAAVAASIISPVNSISSTRLRPIVRLIGTIGVEQNRPMLTPGVAKRASSAAIAQDRTRPRAGNRPRSRRRGPWRSPVAESCAGASSARRTSRRASSYAAASRSATISPRS